MPTMMRDAAISFPLLGSWSIDPSASFTLFGRTFYWYGVIIAVGFILAMLYCARHCRRCGIEPDTLYDFLIWMIPLAIIGARLYYVIFQWSDYRGHPIDALKIWEGGLAIYGGVIAGLLTGIVWCRKKKIPFGAMADVCAPGLLIGQCIGRWGNFINREAFGRETTAFSRMGLTLPGRETVYVHPTFLYESLWNFVGFLLLHFWFRRHERKFDGELILLYAVWYGIGRALIEGLRTDSLLIGNTGLRASQLVAIGSVIVAAMLMVIGLRSVKGRELTVTLAVKDIKKQAEAGDRFAPDTLPANAPHAEFVKATDAMNERLDALDLNEVDRRDRRTEGINRRFCGTAIGAAGVRPDTVLPAPADKKYI